jgi:hypothetical protein
MGAYGFETTAALMAAGCFNEEDLKCLCGRNVGFV